MEIYLQKTDNGMFVVRTYDKGESDYKYLAFPTFQETVEYLEKKNIL